VFDFVHLHAGGWSWYVFNVADAAIVAGVIGLVLDSLSPAGRRGRPDPARGDAAPRS
jgi:signal peptidase II